MTLPLPYQLLIFVLTGRRRFSSGHECVCCRRRNQGDSQEGVQRCDEAIAREFPFYLHEASLSLVVCHVH